MNALNGITTGLSSFTNSITNWINKLFGWGDTFVGSYSKLLVYALLIWVGSKMFHFSFKSGGARK